MSEERLNEIKDSVNFQRKLLWAHNVSIVCVDEAQELIEEIDRLNNIINELEKWLEENIKISKAHDNNLGVNVASIFLDKLKALKENK